MPSTQARRPLLPVLTLTLLFFSISGSTLCAQAPVPDNSAAPPAPAPRPDRFSNFPGAQAAPRQPQPSALPPTPPTALPAGNALPAPIAATPNATPDQPATRPHRAQVTLLNGQLNVRANDSSLNQILHAISRETGLKITGGVKDQRVFGDYGPASTSSILATLLDGTGTNIVLLEGDATTPPELILTPRGGGPTPPSPTDPGYVDDSIEATAAPSPQPQAIQTQSQQYTPQTSGPASIPQPLNNVNGSPLNTSPTASTLPTTNSVPTDSLPTPSTTPATSGIVDAPNPPAPGSTTGTAPNGALTPDQVYQQLLKQQQQQQQSNPQPPPSTPPQ
jgi:hypothetical protein